MSVVKFNPRYLLNKATLPTDVAREGAPRRRRSAPQEPSAADIPSADISFRPASERRIESPAEVVDPSTEEIEAPASRPRRTTTAPRPRRSRRGAETEGSVETPSSETPVPRPRRSREASSARPDVSEPASRDDASEPATRRPEISQEDRLPETRELEGATRALEGTTRRTGGSTPRSLGVIRDTVLAVKEALARHARSIEPEMLSMVREKTHPRVWMMGGEEEPHISSLIARAREAMSPEERAAAPRVRTAIGHQKMEKLHEDDQVDQLMDTVYMPLAYTVLSGETLTGRNEQGGVGLLDNAVGNSAGRRILSAIRSRNLGFRQIPPENLSVNQMNGIVDLLEESARLFVRRANSKSKTSSDSDELVNIGGNTSAPVREMLARRQALISGKTTRVR